MNLLDVILPELVLITVACGLFLLGVSTRVAARRAAAWLAMGGLVVVVLIQGQIVARDEPTISGVFGSIEVGAFANYVKLIAAVVGVLLVLLAWPTNRQATGSRSLEFGHDAGEFYGLMLLALAGLMLVAGANDLMLLFLGIELASIPTYIMVSVSRPIPAAQEAGVKYFFLGAMAAAIMLFGFSYLYGTTGLTKLSEIRALFNPADAAPGAAVGAERAHGFTQWQVLAVCMLLAGFAFKIAAVPLHAYVGDVYQGAATPVTAFLAFVPKTSGFVAIVKTLAAVGGADWRVPPEVVNLLWVLAVLTMTVGNALGLLQHNVKRVLAYSSIAHSGYMLVGITALVAAGNADMSDAARHEAQRMAVSGVLFYLLAYGVMNTGAFGVLMLLPSHEQRYDRGDGTHAHALPATTAETFDDLAGVGRRNISLALAMAVCCFSLIGMPLTVGFFGKLYLVRPALDVGTRQMNWLAVLMMANAAIGAAYYLRIIATMFLRPEPEHVLAAAAAHPHHPHGYSHDHAGTETGRPWWASAVGASIILSSLLTLLLGSVPGVTNNVAGRTQDAAAGMSPVPTPIVAEAHNPPPPAQAVPLSSARP